MAHTWSIVYEQACSLRKKIFSFSRRSSCGYYDLREMGGLKCETTGETTCVNGDKIETTL